MAKKHPGLPLAFHLMTEARPRCFAGLGFIDFRLQLICDVPSVLPGKGDELRVAPTSHNLVVLVHELDRGVCQSFANLLGLATKPKVDEIVTFVANDFPFHQVANLTPGI
jgi:hypothetical protein